MTKPPTMKTIRRRLREAKRSIDFAERCACRAYGKTKELQEAVAGYDLGETFNGPMRAAVEDIRKKCGDAFAAMPDRQMRQLARLLGVVED